MMPHVHVYRSINMTCTIIPHLSMISRSESMKHNQVKNLINGELPPWIFCRKPCYILKCRVQYGPDGMEPPSIAWSRRINKWLRQIHPHRYHLIMRRHRMQKCPEYADQDGRHTCCGGDGSKCFIRAYHSAWD